VTGEVTLAIDAATERLTVAVAHGGQVASLHVDGPRRHAREALGLVDALLAERGLAPRQISRVISGDGPGSFTGLRVASAVAKALVWGRDGIEWWTAPSLLARALGAQQAALWSRDKSRDDLYTGTTVLAISDALRGELYVGCWRFEGATITRRGAAPHAMRPDELDDFGPVDLVIGSIPEGMLAEVAASTGVTPVTGERALPDACWLVALADWQGGLNRVGDAAAWHPEYGRPAEAQAVWEAKHGRRLPDSTHHAG
jgi:tRNA threonylcarbamoyl adenosine modification protein YeaZ